MADEKMRYDKDDATMWVYQSGMKSLVPKQDLKNWVERLKAGQTRDGEPLEHVNYVFGDQKNAEYNHQPLTFSNIGVYLGDLDNPKKYEAPDGDPDFETKKDFGID